MFKGANVMNIIVIDNKDSFVYNLVDMLSCDNADVYRNSIDPDTVINQARRDHAVICLSPGPGTPRDAGTMMQIIDQASRASIPIIGICLGFQALLEASGHQVKRVGPVHGVATVMNVSDTGKAIFGGDIPVARYHSLGFYDVPDNWENWGTSDGIVMAAGSRQLRQAGLQFHPESVLTPGGATILRRLMSYVSE